MGRTTIDFELRVQTPHGAAVQGAFVRVVGPSGTLHGREIGAGTHRFRLTQRGEYEIQVEDHKKAFDCETYRGILHISPSERKCQVVREFLPAPSHAHAASGHEVERRRGVHLVSADAERQLIDVILDYRWFTHIGFPPTLGNRVELLVDGEEGWGAVARTIEKAEQSIRIATWVYDPRMELLRPDPLADPAARVPYTIHRMLGQRAADGVLVQLLLWDPPLLPMPRETFAVAGMGDDFFEVLSEKNPTPVPVFDERLELPNLLLGGLPIGSYHQKTVVIDGRIGYCGGMNLKQNDWDTRLHRIFDPARCRFSRPRAYRKRVFDSLASADHPPRHDFMARIEGPSVAHLEDNFRQRWNRLIEKGVEHAEHSTKVPKPPQCAPVGASAVQVVRTMPAPFEERGILDVWLRAIAAAKRLIYVEDQYFRSVIVSRAIAEAVQKNPRLSVLVITNEAHANRPITGQWNRVCFDIIRDALPDFELYALHSAGVDWREKRCDLRIDNHGKLLIVDDEFLMVGSCNVNDRGFEYEGECNLAIVDRAFVAPCRLDLFRDCLDQDPRLGRSIEEDVVVFREHAAANAKNPPLHREHPFIVPFVPRPRNAGIFGRRVF